MRKSPFKNVHDVQAVARKAFEEITPEFVRNCFDHVKKQEDYYKNLHGIEPLLVEDVETAPDESHTYSETLDADSETNLIFDEEGQVTVLLEANVESIVETPEVPQPFSSSLCEYKTWSPAKFSIHLKSHHNCSECGKSFKWQNSKRNYERHLLTHQRELLAHQKLLLLRLTCNNG